MEAHSPGLGTGACYVGTLQQEESSLPIRYEFGASCQVPAEVAATRRSLGFGSSEECRTATVHISALSLEEAAVATVDAGWGDGGKRVLLQALGAPELGLTVLRWDPAAKELVGGDEEWMPGDAPVVRAKLASSARPAEPEPAKRAEPEPAKRAERERPDQAESETAEQGAHRELDFEPVSRRARTARESPLGDGAELSHVAAARRGALKPLKQALLNVPRDALDLADEDGETALIAAARGGKVPAMQLLLEERASIDATDPGGATALVHAVLRHKPDAVVALLAARARVGLADDEARTPLHYAAAGPQGGVVERMLAAKARANARDIEGRTALMLAARNGRHHAIQLLLDGGAELDAVDEAGWPPLLHAVGGNRPEVCRLLLLRGASRALEIDERPLPQAVRSFDAPACVEVFEEWEKHDEELAAEAELRKDPRYGRKAFM